MSNSVASLYDGGTGIPNTVPRRIDTVSHDMPQNSLSLRKRDGRISALARVFSLAPTNNCRFSTQDLEVAQKHVKSKSMTVSTGHMYNC